MPTTRNRVEVLHGVNLDMLGSRDQDIYGDFTLPELEVKIKRFARDLELEAFFFQTNSRRGVRRAPAPAAGDRRRRDRQRRRLDPLLLGDPRCSRV